MKHRYGSDTLATKEIPVYNPPSRQRRVNPTGLPPLRPEDATLIDAWFTAQQRPEDPTLADRLFTPPTYRLVDEELKAVDSRLRHFARHFSVPLTMVGFERDAGGVTVYNPDVCRKHIVTFAESWIARAETFMTARYRGHCLQRWPNDHPVFRTMNWSKTFLWGTRFFAWLEDHGDRPRGTNPFQYVQRPMLGSMPRALGLRTEDIDTVLAWTVEHARPMDRALIMLGANGLRRSEVVSIRLDSLSLHTGQVAVYGKGSSGRGPKLRMVPLLPWTVAAIDHWLQARTTNHSVWLFPGLTESKHLKGVVVQLALNRALAKALPEGHPAATSTTPHTLRNWFITQARRHGMRVEDIMLTTGHTSMEMFHRYYIDSPQHATEALQQAASTGRWF